jgi:hypothetical protein
VRCGVNNWLDEKILRHIAGGAAVDTDQFPAVAFPCPHCKQMQTLLRQKFVPSEREPMFHGAESQFSTWIKCAVSGCSVVMPLYLLRPSGTTDAEREAEAKSWIWDGLKCPAGHPIAAIAGG